MNFRDAKKILDNLDTLPREAALVALGHDLGKDWVLEHLGYKVKLTPKKKPKKKLRLVSMNVEWKTER